jgi:hypothetical protein
MNRFIVAIITVIFCGVVGICAALNRPDAIERVVARVGAWRYQNDVVRALDNVTTATVSQRRNFMKIFSNREAKAGGEMRAVYRMGVNELGQTDVVSSCMLSVALAGNREYRKARIAEATGDADAVTSGLLARDEPTSGVE